MTPAPMEVGERLATLESGMSEVKKDIHEIRVDFANMRDNLSKRPSWAVSTIITALSSACAGLLVALAQQVGR